jgi:pyridoxine 4-dehydrogenase
MRRCGCLRRAVELGVNFIDTADAYGPMVAEQLIHRALAPYPDGLVIATKAGLTRPGPDVWRPVGRPEYLRQQVEMSLRNSVQNLFNLADRTAEPLLDHAAEHSIAFIPWWPLATGALAAEGGVLAELARRRDVSPSQLALAWLLKRSPVMLPIPGTTSVAHLEENLRGAEVVLTDGEFEQLTNLVYPPVQRPDR